MMRHMAAMALAAWTFLVNSVSLSVPLTSIIYKKIVVIQNVLKSSVSFRLDDLLNEIEYCIDLRP